MEEIEKKEAETAETEAVEAEAAENEIIGMENTYLDKWLAIYEMPLYEIVKMSWKFIFWFIFMLHYAKLFLLYSSFHVNQVRETLEK